MTNNDEYARWANYYDLIYHWKPYREESNRPEKSPIASVRFLGSNGVPDGARVLEAACGTGAYLVHLQQWYDTTGFDISPSMLRIAKLRVPQIQTFCADMTSFEVEPAFDAVLCLFSSIGYLRSRESLNAAARSFAKSLRPGGCLVIEPWVAPDNFEVGMPTQHTFESDDLKLCRSVVSARDGDRAVLDFHWLVTRRNEGVEHFLERHELLFCSPEEMTSIFSSVGFDCRWESDGLMKGRGLLLGKRVD